MFKQPSSSLGIGNDGKLTGWFGSSQSSYRRQMGNREPIASMRETSERIRSLTSGWSPQQFERTYAPGKWTARQILTHLAETDVALRRKGRPIPINDVWIASVALVRRAILVTNDEHFASVDGLTVENWTR